MEKTAASCKDKLRDTCRKELSSVITTNTMDHLTNVTYHYVLIEK